MKTMEDVFNEKNEELNTKLLESQTKVDELQKTLDTLFGGTV